MGQMIPLNAIVNSDHPRWYEFLVRLSERIDEHGDRCGGPVGHGGHARDVLKEMGNIDVDRTLSTFDDQGGHCDCEILMNCVEYGGRVGGQDRDE